MYRWNRRTGRRQWTRHNGITGRRRIKKIHGVVLGNLYKQVVQTEDTLVVGRTTLYKTKINQAGKIKKYKCRHAAQNSRYNEVCNTRRLKLATAPIQMLFAIAAARRGVLLRHFDVEQAFLEVDSDV